MEKQAQEHFQTNPSHTEPDQPEPVRTRWTPKPEQILILESIFNSGMVNPPKEETVRIRKLLEKFGTVRDANVFYWFQNRRSRSRRRQRQQQASSGPQRLGNYNSLFLGNSSSSCSSSDSSNRSPSYYHYNSNVASGAIMSPSGTVSCTSATSSLNPNNLRDEAGDDLFAISCQFGLMESEHSPNSACLSNLPQLHYQPTGPVTVFINGITWEVPRGPLDMRSMFGHDAMLVHSSGELIPVNEYGFLMKGLQMGESYFLVSRSV